MEEHLEELSEQGRRDAKVSLGSGCLPGSQGFYGSSDATWAKSWIVVWSEGSRD